MSLATMKQMKHSSAATRTYAHVTSSRYEHPSRYMNSMSNGSAMPLELETHWSWNNPLNIIPALLVAFFLLALVAMLI